MVAEHRKAGHRDRRGSSLAIMVAPTGAQPPDATLVAEVIGLIERTEPPAHRDMLRTFATLYLKRLPDSDAPDLDPGELLAEIEDLLAFVSASPPPDPHVRVVVPDADEVGYSTIGSVIQVIAPDGPFLVDSVTAAVTKAGAGIVRHLHPVIGTERSHDGTLVAVSTARMSAHRESVQHFEVDRRLDAAAAKALEESIRSVLRDVQAAVDDFDPMRRAVARMAEAAKASVHSYGYEEIAEAVAFLEWL